MYARTKTPLTIISQTPLTLISRPDQEIVRVISQAERKELSFNAGVEIVGNPPQAPVVKMKSEATMMGKMIHDADICVE